MLKEGRKYIDLSLIVAILYFLIPRTALAQGTHGSWFSHPGMAITLFEKIFQLYWKNLSNHEELKV